MATFLDVGLIENFGIIFVILLIFLIMFGLLEYIKAFGEDRRGLHAIIALVVALLFLVSKIATKIVAMMVPWFMVVALFIFFTLFLVRMFGLDEAGVKKLIANPNVYPWIIAFAGLILFFSLGNAFGQSLLEKGEGIKQPANYTAGTQTSTEMPATSSGLQPATPGTRSTTTTSFTTNLLNTLRHPKVMGLLFVFLVGMFALIFLTKPAKP